MTSKQIAHNGVLALYKRPGETPLQCLDRLRFERPEFVNATLSYAGRLDPLAEGLMLVLVGSQTNRDREKYLNLSKRYEVEVLFGVATDSYDVLGLTLDNSPYDASIVRDRVAEIIKDISNFNEMSYPPFSSKPIKGKSLFQWARDGQIEDIELPKQKGKITKIELATEKNLGKDDLERMILKTIDSVNGDFRQDEIREKWTKFFEENEQQGFMILKFNIECESGAYMRSFADQLGKLITTPALAFNILRTKVGEYDLSMTLK